MNPYACYLLSRTDVATLCREWNALTAPWTLKTDEQHAIDDARARTIRQQLAGRAIEDDNGKLKPR